MNSVPTAILILNLFIDKHLLRQLSNHYCRGTQITLKLELIRKWRAGDVVWLVP